MATIAKAPFIWNMAIMEVVSVARLAMVWVRVPVTKLWTPLMSLVIRVMISPCLPEE